MPCATIEEIRQVCIHSVPDRVYRVCGHCVYFPLGTGSIHIGYGTATNPGDIQ
jgi:hypothetical protein